jgi:ABC-type phosphate transport system auxiliary subunit
MNGLEQRKHGTVTERLAARLNDVEPVVVRLIDQDGQLLAAGRQLTTRVETLEDQIQALTAETERLSALLSQHGRGVMVLRVDVDHAREPRAWSLWSRLRWLVCRG